MATWVDVGTMDDIPRQGARVVRYRDTEIAIFRTIDDELFALRNVCAHKKGPLADGIVHNCRVTCPLHNWVFELESGEAVGPDEGTVPSYPVRLNEGRMQLQLPVLPADCAGESPAKQASDLLWPSGKRAAAPT